MFFLSNWDISNITNSAYCHIISYMKSLVENRGNWLKFTVRMHFLAILWLSTDTIPTKVLDITRCVAYNMQDV